MAKIRRVLRKLAPADRSFDEQLWPVMLALLVFGGYLVGVVLAFCRFDSFRSVVLGVSGIVSVILLVGGSILLLLLFNNRIANRRTLLALVLSLIINFVLISTTTRWIWHRDPELITVVGPEEEFEQKVIPEYQEFQVNPQSQPKQDFQKPVETEVLEPEREEIEQDKEEVEEAEAKPEEVDVPDPQDEVQPNDVERKEIAQTAPRRNEQQSKLSRQETKFKPLTAAPAATVKVEPTQRPSQVAAQQTKVQRSPCRHSAKKRKRWIRNENRWKWTWKIMSCQNGCKPWMATNGRCRSCRAFPAR